METNKSYKLKSTNTIFFVAYITLILCSMLFAIKENVYHGELDVYLPHYLGNKSFLSIIFDPLCELDLTGKSFRGREIGNMFNFADAKLLALLFKFHIPAFISLIYYLSLFTVVTFVTLTTKHLYKNNQTIIQLNLLLLLTSPPIVFGGIFYRTNKIISGTALIFSIFLLDLIKNRSKKDEKFLYYSLFFASAIAALSDEQGLILISLILICDFLNDIINQNKINKSQQILAFSLLFTLFYRSFMGPFLFEYLNGINPTTAKVNFHELINISNLYNSFNLLTKYRNYLFVNFDISARVLIPLWIALLYLIFKNDNTSNSDMSLKHKKVLLIPMCALAGLVLIIHVMTLKHPAIFWPDIISYYSLPIICFIFGITCISLNRTKLPQNTSNKIIPVLTLLIIMNIFSWPESYTKITEGHLKAFRVADTVVSAVYAHPSETRDLLSKISINVEVSGKIPSLNIGEEGVKALKKSLQENNI